MAAAIISFVMLVAVAPASVHASTREQWVKGANRICGAIADRNVELVDRFERQLAAEHYSRAAALIIKVFKRSERVYVRIGELDRPANDARAIGRFVSGERRALALGIRAGRSLDDGRVSAFDRKLDRAARIDRQAQREIRGFKPRACFAGDEGEV